jgi:hypothetical protein
MPWSDVSSGTFKCITGGVAAGLAGSRVKNNVLAGAASYVDYQVGVQKKVQR